MNDDELLTLLGQALAGDRPPTLAIEAAYHAFEWRTLDADLAALLEDDQIEVVLFDSAAYSRVLSYVTDFGSVELGVDDDRLEVSVTPIARSVTLHQPDHRLLLSLDVTGRATAEGLSGPVRFEITWPEGTSFTPWITL